MAGSETIFLWQIAIMFVFYVIFSHQLYFKALISMALDQFISFNFTFSPKFILPPNFLPFAPSRPIFGKNFRSTPPFSKFVRPPQYELEDFCSVHVLAWSKYTKRVDKRIPSIMIQIFPSNVCVTKMGYRITVTLASKAWQGHC